MRARMTPLARVLPTGVVRVGQVWHRARGSGRSAESAFWLTFTLPWVLLGLLASAGLFTQRLDPIVLARIQQSFLDAAARVLTPQAVDDYLQPLVDQVLKGRAGLTVIGLLVALWSGARLVETLVDGICAMHGAPRRRYARRRGLALAIYVIGLLGAGLAIGVLALGPDRVSAFVGPHQDGEEILAYVVLVAVALAMLVLLYRMATPTRAPWRHDLVGALTALTAWLIGSLGLHLYAMRLFDDFSVYAAVAAPLAVLLWAYVTAAAILGGAAVVVVLGERRSGGAGAPGEAGGDDAESEVPSGEGRGRSAR